MNVRPDRRLDTPMGSPALADLQSVLLCVLHDLAGTNRYTGVENRSKNYIFYVLLLGHGCWIDLNLPLISAGSWQQLRLTRAPAQGTFYVSPFSHGKRTHSTAGSVGSHDTS